MYHSLSKLLKGHDPALAAHIRKLEEITGANSEDIRLDQEITQTIRHVCEALALDSADTRPKELFHAVQARFREDSEKIGTDFSELSKQLSAAFDATAGESLCVKAVVLKKILKANPPKNLIKQLGYRSLDSMLKREKPGELLLAASLVEPSTWQKKCTLAVSKLKHTDFASEPLQLVCSDEPRWQKVAEHLIKKNGHTVLSSWISGTIMLLCPPALPGVNLANVYAVQDAVRVCRGHGSLLRFVHVGQHFHDHFTQLLHGTLHIFSLAGHDVGWWTVMRLLSQMEEDVLQARFGLHITPNDFAVPDLVRALSEKSSTLTFWGSAMDYAVVEEEGHSLALSMHHTDIARSLIPRHVSFEQADARYGLEALEHELLIRYALHPIISEQILLQLEHL